MSADQDSTLGADDTAFVKFHLSGERARLKQVARERLEEAGWHDELRELCREFASQRGPEVTAAEIVEAVRAAGLSKVPDHIKAELLKSVKATLES